MERRFPSLTSPPLGTPAHQQPDSSLSAFFPPAVASSSQHRIEPGFPSLVLMGFSSLPCLSHRLLLGTILRDFLPSPTTSLTDLS